MNIDFNKIGMGTGVFDVGQKVEGQSIEGHKSKNAIKDLQICDGGTLDVLNECEPVVDVPDDALALNDDLGRLVSSAFNLQPPPMPNFNV